jgi:hypothetical protein
MARDRPIAPSESQEELRSDLFAITVYAEALIESELDFRTRRFRTPLVTWGRSIDQIAMNLKGCRFSGADLSRFTP